MKQKIKPSAKRPLHPLIIVLFTIFAIVVLGVILLALIGFVFSGKDNHREENKNFQTVASELKDLRGEMLKDDLFTDVSELNDKCVHDGGAFGVYQCEINMLADSQGSSLEINTHLKHLLKKTEHFDVVPQVDEDVSEQLGEVKSRKTNTPCLVDIRQIESIQKLYLSCKFSSREQLHIKQ